MGKMTDALRLLEGKWPDKPWASPLPYAAPSPYAGPEAGETASTASATACEELPVEAISDSPGECVNLEADVIPDSHGEHPGCEADNTAVSPHECVDCESADVSEHHDAPLSPPHLRVVGRPDADDDDAAAEDASNDDAPSPLVAAHPRVVWPKPSRRDLRAFSETADRLLSPATADKPRVVVFSGVGEEWATASLLLTLAPIVADRANGRILVIDANSRHPKLTQHLCVSAAHGFADAACGEIDWPELVRETNVPDMDFLPGVCDAGICGAGVPPAPAAAMALPRLDGLDAGRALGEMGMHYAMVLIDAGAVERLDTVRLGRYCDGACLAVRLGEASRDSLERAVESLRLAQVNVLGAIAINTPAELAGCR